MNHNQLRSLWIGHESPVALKTPWVNIAHTASSTNWKIIFITSSKRFGLPWWLSGKETASNAGDSGSIPELGRSPGEGNHTPLQYSCLGSPKDRGAWWTTVHCVTKESDMTEHTQTDPQNPLGQGRGWGEMEVFLGSALMPGTCTNVHVWIRS